MKNPWKLATAALGGLLLLSLIAGAFLMGRTASTPTATTPAPQQQPAAPTPAPSATPAPDPNATTGNALAKGPVVAGAGGIADGPGGLHIRYPHTRDGAVAAATNYYQAIYTPQLYTDPTQRTALAKQLADGPEATKQLEELLAKTAPLADDLSRTNVTRGAYAVKSFSPDQVTVMLWVQICDRQKSKCGFTRVQVPVVWSREDWRLISPTATNDAALGPDPRDPRGVPSNVEKYELLKNPPPAADDRLYESYKLPWLEYANAAR